jgi:hypothetical protein
MDKLNLLKDEQEITDLATKASFAGMYDDM